MGLWDFLKRAYTEEYDELENLEDLVYDDESLEFTDEEDESNDNVLKLKPTDKQMNLSQLFDGFDIGEEYLEEEANGNESEEDLSEGRVKTRQKQEKTKLDEEKYDHLLNSVQAQTLIKTVENYSQEKKGKPVEKREVKIPDVTRKPKQLEEVDVKKFKTSDIELYVKSQCDIMEEAATYVENARAEYEAVTEQYNDIQLIEGAPDSVRNKLARAAEVVDTMAVDRRIYKTSEQKLSNAAYRRIEAIEHEFPKAVKLLYAQEEYYDTVKRDMRMVEGERMSLRMEAKGLVKRQLRIRNLAKTAIVSLLCVFLIFIIAMAVVIDDDTNTAIFIIVSMLAAILAVGMFALLKSTERNVLKCEIKLNKATALLNKIKIKYINAANILDYEYNKYDVKSAYELDNRYKLYLEMKEEQKRIMDMTSALNSAELELEESLKKLGLYDAKIWLGQVRALYNPKEMVEVRHELTVKRQKLRSQIEFNENRINEAKQNIKKMTLSNPEYSHDALRVIELYEKKHR